MTQPLHVTGRARTLVPLDWKEYGTIPRGTEGTVIWHHSADDLWEVEFASPPGPPMHGLFHTKELEAA